MELEGFGASLVGRTIYVQASGRDAWIPWEFISGTQYNCKLFITSDSNNYRCLELENTWTMIVRPLVARDWSCIATILKGMGGSILLAFDEGCPKVPESFHTYLESIVQEGRTVLTRVWVGLQVELPVVPDAIFFPVLIQSEVTNIYTMLMKLPGRNSHGPFSSMSLQEWTAMVEATVQSNVGMVVSDIGESKWSLFWHKLADSDQGENFVKKGVAWLKTATVFLEKHISP